LLFFSIRSWITLESVLMMKVCWPRAFIFLNARSRASYSVVLFVECSSFANMSRAAYLITIHVGDVTTAEIPTPMWHQAPSHYTTQGVSISSPGLWIGEVQSMTKSAKTCDLIALLLSKSTMYSDSSAPHLMIHVDASLFANKSFNSWFVTTLILWLSK
jgi:hypothetical protein